MQKITSQSSTSFGIRPLAQWRGSSAVNNKPKSIIIAELELRDYQFMQDIKNEWLVHPQSRDSILNSIVEGALLTIEALLAGECKFLEKVKMLIAIQNYKPCGLLIGNMPKRVLHTESISYSSRHNNSKSETEIDWLATWTPKGEEKIKGVGKSLVAEFFGSLKKDKFRDVFVKSELPENSYAQNFYESMGFELLGKKRTLLANNTSSEYIVSNYADEYDRVIPMIISRGKLRACYEELSKKMCRQEFIKTSVATEDLITKDNQ